MPSAVTSATAPGVVEPRSDRAFAVAREERHDDPADLANGEQADRDLGDHRHEEADGVALARAQARERRSPPGRPPRSAPHRSDASRGCGAPSSPSQRSATASPRPRRDPLVEAVVRDVHHPVDAPGRPLDAAAEVGDPGVGLRRTGCPRSARTRSQNAATSSRERGIRSSNEARVPRDAVAAHEADQVGLRDHGRIRLPHKVACERGIRHGSPPSTVRRLRAVNTSDDTSLSSIESTILPGRQV